MKLGQLLNITKETFLPKTSTKKLALKQDLGQFYFQKILCKRESGEDCVLIFTYFHSSAVTYSV